MAALSQAITLCSQTSPTTAAGVALTTAVTGLSQLDAITIIATITGATGGALDVCVQHSPDGTTWYDYVHFAQAAAAAAAVTYSYAPSLNDAIVTIGTSASTITLTAGTAAGGHWFDQMRVMLLPGATTTVGATQTVTLLAHRNG